MNPGQDLIKIKTGEGRGQPGAARSGVSHRWIYLFVIMLEVFVLCVLGYFAFTNFWSAGLKARHRSLAIQSRAESTSAFLAFEHYVMKGSPKLLEESSNHVSRAVSLLEKLVEGFSTSEEVRRAVSGDDRLEDVDGIIEGTAGARNSVDTFSDRMELRDIAHSLILLEGQLERLRSEVEQTGGASNEKITAVRTEFTRLIPRIENLESTLQFPIRNEVDKFNYLYILSLIIVLALLMVSSAIVVKLELQRDRDFDEIRGMTRALEESEREYRKLVEGANSVVLRFDPEGIIRFINEYGRRFFGYKREEIIGQHMLDTIVPKTESTGRDLEVMIQRLTSDPDMFVINENENVRKDGSRIWMSWSNRGVRDREGNLSEILSVGTDVTERKISEEAIRKLDEQYRLVVENANEGIAIIKDSFVKYVNPKLEVVTGYTPEELGERPFTEYIHEDERKEVETMMSKLSGGLESPDIKSFKFVVKDGALRWMEMKVKRITWDEQPATLHFISDITERKEAEEELRKLATTDPLTGALNRRRFMELGEEELYRARRYANPLSILMLDLDHFKKINDTHGHAAGDDVLVRFVEKCVEELRLSDSFGRLGGEEFAALLPETDTEGAKVVADRLRKRIGDLDLRSNGKKIRFTVSIGVSQLRESDPNIEPVLNRADSALYKAKNAGRNTVVSN